MKTALAIDLGGTRYRMALLTSDGNILQKVDNPTSSFPTPQSVVSESAQFADRLLSKAQPKTQLLGLAAAIAGTINQRQGFLQSSPNLPKWKDVPLRMLLETATGLPCILENDANAGAWGEFKHGAGQGYSDFLYVTVSTGIGGGIIINNQLYRGAIGTAGEIGHITVEPSGPTCMCGNHGCLETMASGTAIARFANDEISKGTPTLLTKLTDSTSGKVTAKQVGQAAQMGDVVAINIVRNAATYLGIGLAGLVNVLNPKVIIIGGGVSNLGPTLLKPVEETVRSMAYTATRDLQIIPASLGDDAGLVGAGALLFEQFK